jgi:sulfatase maturation enzyme AslB (radical SAM superfamily)
MQSQKGAFQMNKQSMARKLRINLKEVLRKTSILPLIKIVKNDIPKKLFKKYDAIFCDITNICNLRCPHCYNNWKDEYLQETLLMSMEHFEKALQVALLTQKGNFLLSCAFEPTLHPKFNEILRAIPANLQKQIAFTTNLSTNISEEVLETLSYMQLHHINISIESFTPEIYEQCRKNAQYKRFITNLEQLSSVIQLNGRDLLTHAGKISHEMANWKRLNNTMKEPPKLEPTNTR